jgi:hypothetical protein
MLADLNMPVADAPLTGTRGRRTIPLQPAGNAS